VFKLVVQGKDRGDSIGFREYTSFGGPSMQTKKTVYVSVAY
jgi:hypothetical protein